VSRYAATPLIVALSPGHSDIKTFRQWSRSRPTGNHLDRCDKFQNLLRRLAPLRFLISLQAFREQFRGKLPHVHIFMNDGHNPSREILICSATDLAEIWRSSKIFS
jgi:hypothetical protein